MYTLRCSKYCLQSSTVLAHMSPLFPYTQEIFHYMGLPFYVFTYLLTTLGSFSLFGSHEDCNYEHLCANFCVQVFSCLKSRIVGDRLKWDLSRVPRLPPKVPAHY